LAIVGQLRLKPVIAAIVTLFSISCQQAPVLPEAEKAKEIESRLWRAGASSFAAEEYNSFYQALRTVRIHELKERARLPLWRRLKRVQEEYQRVIEDGIKLLALVEERKQSQAKDLRNELSELEGLITKLRAISSAINESRHIRQRITRAEVLIEEAKRNIEKVEFSGAKKAMAAAREPALSARRIVLSLFERYLDESYLRRWEKWVAETIAESRAKNNLAIIVDKLEKKLVVYSQGEKIETYDVGLGRFGLADKLHAGDEATPEGKYKVVKKNPNSRYYKALLLDYPNEDDRRRFQEMKKRGLIPPRIGIGGLIEIHGGGQDGLTYGCVAMEDEAIDELYEMAEVGTPVTIVGTVNRDSIILNWVREL